MELSQLAPVRTSAAAVKVVQFELLQSAIYSHNTQQVSRKAQICVRLSFGILLASLTFVLYSGVRHHEFTTLDDTDYITENPQIMAGLSWEGLCWSFTHTVSSNWHPLTCLSHMLDCQLFGLNAGAHHLESVGIHIGNTLLLLLFLARASNCFWRSAFVAALFAVHPLHVESVAWVSERKDVLSTFFFLLTLIAYAAYARREESESGIRTDSAKESSWGRGRRLILYLTALVLFALGLMSKPMVVTLPFVLLLLDYWPLHRIQIQAQHPIRKLVLEKIPFLLLSAASSVLTLWAQGTGHSIATLDMIPLWNRIIHAVASYSSYLGKIFWPTNLGVCYGQPNEVEYGLATLSLVLLAGISALAIAWRKSRPYFLIGWLWYLGTLVPVIGLVQVGIQGMADRYTYIPSMGIFIALTWLVSDLAGSWKATRSSKSIIESPGRVRVMLLSGSAMMVWAACAILSYAQIATWRNTRTLFEHASRVTERNFMAYAALGNLLAREGNTTRAIEYFRSSIRWMPSYPISWLGLGNALISTGNQIEGEACLKKMLELSPNDPELIDGYALMLMKERKAAEAESYFRRALELRPGFPEGHLHLAVLLQQQGRWDEAVEQYQWAIRFKPGAADLHLWYGDALLKRKQFDEAMEQYHAALRVQADSLQAQLGLGGALVEKRRFEEAAACFSAVLNFCPTNAAALDGLGYTLAVRSRPEEAYPYFVKATTVCPTNSFAQLHLAMELARRGESGQAAAHYRLAITNGEDLVLGMNNLAWMLATHPSAEIRNGPEAVELAERACKITNDKLPFLIGTLAAAYAEAGRFDEATRAAEKAQKLAQSLGMADLAERNVRMLELYRAGKPYREVIER